MELQKELVADRPLKDGQKFALPDAWQNVTWPQAGGFPNHSMQNLFFSPDAPKKVWSADIGRGSTNDLVLTSQPVVAAGMIFTLDTKSQLSAFKIENGKKAWSKNIKNKDEDEQVISGGIAFAKNVLYVSTGYDEVLAFNAQDGELVWRKRLPAPSRAAPTILGNKVFVSTIDSRLLALNAANGTGVWEYTGISEATALLGAASPAANNEIVVPVFSSGEVTALRAENGSVAWSDNLANVRRYGGGLESLADIKAMPIIDRGMVIVISAGGKLAAINETTGERIWERDISGSQTPWVSGNHVYVVSTENQVIAFSALDGSIFWITQLPQYKNAKNKTGKVHWTGPIMASGRLVVAGSNGRLAEIEPHKGGIIRMNKTKKSFQIAPIIANNMLFLLAEDGTLIAYK